MNSDCTAVEQDLTDIATRVRSLANRFPDEVAIVFDDTDIRWSDFLSKVDALANTLSNSVSGSKIALSLSNGPELLQALFATLWAGKSFQVFDPDWPADTRKRLETVLRPDLMLESSNVTAFSSQGYNRRSDTNSFPQVDLRAPFYTGFTSGSTGLPKGFRRNQLSWLESFRRDGEIFDLSRDDVFISLGSLAHSLFVYAVFRGLYTGGTTVFYRRFRPDRILHSIAGTGGTVVYGVPTQYDALVGAARGEVTLPSVRLVLSSGAKLPDALKPALRRLFPKALICEFYGTSEQSYVTFARDGETPSGSVGRPFPGVDVTVRDDAGTVLPTGGVGRVFVSGPLLFDGYELADNPTLEYQGDALFVGDIGYFDEKGFLYLTGRSDRMFISSGKNIYPEEIESAVAAHPTVKHVCVVGVNDPRRGQRPVALLQLETNGVCSSRELKAWCREVLPLHKVPSRFYEVDDWPMTVSQKSDIPRLLALLRSGSTRTLR